MPDRHGIRRLHNSRITYGSPGPRLRHPRIPHRRSSLRYRRRLRRLHPAIPPGPRRLHRVHPARTPRPRRLPLARTRHPRGIHPTDTRRPRRVHPPRVSRPILPFPFFRGPLFAPASLRRPLLVRLVGIQARPSPLSGFRRPGVVSRPDRQSRRGRGERDRVQGRLHVVQGRAYRGVLLQKGRQDVGQRACRGGEFRLLVEDGVQRGQGGVAGEGERLPRAAHKVAPRDQMSDGGPWGRPETRSGAM